MTVVVICLFIVAFRSGPVVPPPPDPYNSIWPAYAIIAPGTSGVSGIRVAHATQSRRHHPRDIATAIARALDENTLGAGQAKLNWDNEMRVAVPYTTTLRIAQSDIEKLSEGLKGVMSKTIPQLRITPRMQAILAGDGFIDISGGDPPIQLVDGGTAYTQWRWNILPKSIGIHRLQMSISCIITGDRVPETAKVVHSESLDVTVRMNWRHLGDQFIESKVPDLISILMTSAVSALLLWLCRRLAICRRRRRIATRRAVLQSSRRDPPPPPPSQA